MDAQYTPTPPHTHTHQPLSFSLHAHLLIDLQGGTAPCVGVQSVVHASACAFAFQLGSGIGQSEPVSACWPRDWRAVGPPDQGSTWTYGPQLTLCRTHRHSQTTSELVYSCFSMLSHDSAWCHIIEATDIWSVAFQVRGVCVCGVGGGWWVVCVGMGYSESNYSFRARVDRRPTIGSLTLTFSRQQRPTGARGGVARTRAAQANACLGVVDGQPLCCAPSQLGRSALAFVSLQMSHGSSHSRMH